MAAITIKALEDAVIAQVLAASQLASSQVVLADQNFSAPPAGDYLNVRVAPMRLVGGSPGSWNYDSGRSAGQEIELTAEGPVEVQISVEATTAATENGQAADARALLIDVQLQLQTEGVLEELRDAGVGLFDFGRVQGVPRVYGAAIEGRATLVMRAYAVMAARPRRTGYIATAELTGTFTP